MCGIAGWLGQDIDIRYSTEILKRLIHRGPDGGGEWRCEGVWFGHRRLAVLDLTSDGRQPMISASGRYVLTYNGEVYNYLELRCQLKQAGVAFRGHSDTEVVLAACEYWGVESAVARFEGMFAFSLYDIRERVLWLARDPLGIKPLYYAARGEEFAFASELQALQPLPWLDDSIDPAALYAYFRYLCVPTPASILRGVRKLLSGSLLRRDDEGVRIIRYWNAEACARAARKDPLDLNFTAAADELEVRLRRSVRLHMQSDVPYGAFLSGGVDSSTIVALMQAESSRPVKTFSIGFTDISHDESRHARTVAQHLGTDHHELILNAEDVPGLIPTVASYYDEPFADGSSIPTFLVSKFAREHVTVSLSGDGGDELFGGYPRYFWASRIEKWRNQLTRRGAELSASILKSVPSVFWDDVVNPLSGHRYGGATGLSDRIRRFSAYLGCSRDQAYAITMSAWACPEQLIGSAEGLLGADAVNYPDLTWAEEMMLVDQGVYLQDDILTKVDRASMAVSLEARVPLLTHSLVEWSWRVPLHFKFAEKGDQGKLLLREVLYRHVPKALIERPKQGFGMPMSNWLRGPLRDWAESLLRPEDIEGAGLNSGLVTRVWAEHLSGENRLPQLWTVLMYRQWLENWVRRSKLCVV